MTVSSDDRPENQPSDSSYRRNFSDDDDDDDDDLPATQPFPFTSVPTQSDDYLPFTSQAPNATQDQNLDAEDDYIDLIDNVPTTEELNDMIRDIFNNPSTPWPEDLDIEEFSQDVNDISAPGENQPSNERELATGKDSSLGNETDSVLGEANVIDPNSSPREVPIPDETVRNMKLVPLRLFTKKEEVVADPSNPLASKYQSWEQKMMEKVFDSTSDLYLSPVNDSSNQSNVYPSFVDPQSGPTVRGEYHDPVRWIPKDSSEPHLINSQSRWGDPLSTNEPEDIDSTFDTNRYPVQDGNETMENLDDPIVPGTSTQKSVNNLGIKRRRKRKRQWARRPSRNKNIQKGVVFESDNNNDDDDNNDTKILRSKVTKRRKRQTSMSRKKRVKYFLQNL